MVFNYIFFNKTPTISGVRHDTKGGTISRKSKKVRKYKGQKMTNNGRQNTTQKIKD